MNMDDADMNTALMVDGNAVAGQLMDVFGRDMTIAVARCAGCAREAEMGALMAFTRGPGVVLRCPACEAAIARVVETPTAIYVEARGASFLRLPRYPQSERPRWEHPTRARIHAPSAVVVIST